VKKIEQVIKNKHRKFSQNFGWVQLWGFCTLRCG